MGIVHDQAIAGEIMPGCMAAALGHTDHLEVPFLLRQDHTSRDSLPALVDWIVDSGFAASYAVMERNVAEAAVSVEGETARESAIQALRAGLSTYIGTRMAPSAPSRWNRIKAPLRAMRGRLAAARVARVARQPAWRSALESVARAAKPEGETQ